MNTCPDFTIVIALKEEFKEATETFRSFWSWLLVPHFDLGELTPEDGAEGAFAIKLASANGQLANGTVLLLDEKGPFRALDKAKDYLAKATPHLLVVIGISGKVSKDLRLGDVAVATVAWEYAENLKAAGGTDFIGGVQPGSAPFPTTEHIWKEYSLFEVRRKANFQLWQASAVDHLLANSTPDERSRLAVLGLDREPPSIHHGPIATGPYLVADERLKTWLTTHVDRDMVCVDQESAEILRAAAGNRHISTLVLRGISDGADSSKAELETLSKRNIRRWALSNAVSLFISMMAETQFSSGEILFLDAASEDNTYDQALATLHSFAVQSFLRAPYNRSPAQQEIGYDSYGRFFNEFIRPNVDAPDELFETISDWVNESAAPVVYIDGSAGSGKSAFLSVFYWYLKERYEAAPTDVSRPIPIFVSASIAGQVPGGSERARVVETYLVDTLRRIIRCAENRRIWVLLDGKSYEEPLAHAVRNAVASDDRGKCLKQVISARDSSDEGQPDAITSFSAVNFTPENAEQIVESFLEICLPRPGTGAKDNLLSFVNALGGEDLDMFLLSKNFQKISEQGTGAKSLPQFLRSYVRDRLGIPSATTDREKERILTEVGELAYKLCVRGDLAAMQDYDPVVAEMLDEHRFVLEYMSARYIIRAYEKAHDGEVRFTDRVLGTVYPYSLNRFVKAILNRRDREGRCFIVYSVIKQIIQNEETSFAAKANACYLLGRINNEQLRVQARELLGDVQKNLNKRSPYLSPGNRSVKESRQYLLFVRTVYISLAHLGDQEAEALYVTRLLEDRASDQINRGFHLEYYGDIRYNLSEPLVHLDRLGPFPRTLKELSGRIEKPDQNPLLNLEVQTLCSLALQRHFHGKLSDPERDRVLHVVQAVLDARKLHACVEDYARFSTRSLNRAHAAVGEEALDYFKVKLLPRKGWLKRRVNAPETVGSHTFGAYLLGLLFLPDEIDGNPDFDKQRVLEMVAVHDLEEGIMGDLLPEEKNREKEELAKAIIRDLTYLGTIEGSPDYSKIFSLWIEFHQADTINSRLAVELDKLDAISELYRLRSVGQIVDDFHVFEKDLKSKIHTPIGKQILDSLASYYDRILPNADRIEK